MRMKFVSKGHSYLHLRSGIQVTVLVPGWKDLDYFSQISGCCLSVISNFSTMLMYYKSLLFFFNLPFWHMKRSPQKKPVAKMKGVYQTEFSCIMGGGGVTVGERKGGN